MRRIRAVHIVGLPLKVILFFVLLLSGLNTDLFADDSALLPYAPPSDYGIVADSLLPGGQTATDTVIMYDSIPAISDSLIAGLPDTAVKKGFDVDSIITASCTDSLVFYVNNKRMELFGTGDLNYKSTRLQSGIIYVDFVTAMVDAFGIPRDTSQQNLSQTPTLTERGDTYTGSRMRYNFKTRQGYITYAGTETEDANYTGARIKKVDDNTFFIEKGFYTTCEDSIPHYGFFCYEMKVVPKEQVIGKWIFLTFGGVPFPVPLPFAVFPLESGRRSGIVPPVYGQDNRFGKYFKRFGYFWAMNDYMDLLMQGDYYLRGGYALEGRYRYAKRYDLTGSINASFSDRHEGEKTDPDRYDQKDYRISIQHNQIISPTSRFDANLQFMSSDYYRTNSTDYNQLLQNSIYSNASYYKSWESVGVTLSAGYSKNQNLINGNSTEVLPTVSVSKTQFYPFRRKVILDEEHWYEKIGFDYSGQFQNRRDKNEVRLNVRGGVQHNISVNAAQKIGYFNIAPSIRYQERWYSKYSEQAFVKSSFTGRDTLVTTDRDEINFVRTFDLGLRASSKIYGVFPVNNFGIEAVRHILTPSISYTFTPDYSRDFWGYYGSYRDSTGKEFLYNKYQNEIFGGPARGERQSIQLGIDNVFEMKTSKDPTDTVSQQDKIQLLNLSASVGYNFAADSLRFSDINISYRTSIGSWLNISGGSSYTLYDYDSNGRDINRFLISEGKGFLRLRNVSLSLTTTLAGQRSNTRSETTEINPIEEQSVLVRNNPQIHQGIYYKYDPDFTIPWSLNLSYNYSFSKFNPFQTFRTSSISSSFDFNLTKAWKFTVSGTYDFVNKDFSAPRIVISRDLHCWVMNFTWNPIGLYRGYQLEIRVKAPQLQDLKLEKSDRFFSGR